MRIPSRTPADPGASGPLFVCCTREYYDIEGLVSGYLIDEFLLQLLVVAGADLADKVVLYSNYIHTYIPAVLQTLVLRVCPQINHLDSSIWKIRRGKSPDPT
jgi:hypothetical protein